MSTALYRRYRPEAFSDVIGQEHVTEPLMTAISKDRVNHAYLFSGPRGCGKTTSARILARCLNCAQGPTPVPCGTCDSCVELARNGSGSLDVIEIDAASHGGVDDARDLRERATFAPVRDRYKIFIIDEAHMVTSAGFNALLKIVEEPPEHIKFIFATTEPDKVIGTIRSRTHHYPFRLVPPEPLMAYLELLCNQENIAVAPGVLSLVVRAGGGSVRDSLSVLDQLMAGAGASGLDYELAVSLLGYTHASLLDDVVDAVAADDSATVFGAIDRVIQTGHDPRRFVEDLLERFRDLIIVNAVPDAAASILRGVPDDQLNRMRTQAQQLGRAELSRAADITNTALTEMTGATSPRLHLELLCARILLPAADQSEQGTLARVDRIERRLSYASGLPDAVAAPASESASPQPGLASSGSSQQGLGQSESPQPGSSQPEAASPGSSAPGAGPASFERETTPNTRAQRESSATPESATADWGGGWGLPAEPTNPAGQSVGTGQQQSAQSQPAQPQRSARSGDQTRSGDQAQLQDPNQFPQARPQRPQGTSEPVQHQRPEPPHESTQPVQPGSSQPIQSSSSQPVQPGSSQPVQPQPVGSEAAQSRPMQLQRPDPAPSRQAPDARQSGHPQQVSQERQPAHSPSAPSPQASQQGSGQIEMIRRAWPEIMDELARIKRSTWLNVNTDAKPRAFKDNQLVLAFASQGNALGFQRGQHADNLKQAINKVLGLTCGIEALHDGSESAGEPDPKVPTSRNVPADGPQRSDNAAPGTPSQPEPSQPEQSASGPASKWDDTPGPIVAGADNAAMPSGPLVPPASTSPATPNRSQTPVPPAPGVQHPAKSPTLQVPAAPDTDPNHVEGSPGGPVPTDALRPGPAGSTPDDDWLRQEPPADPDDPGPQEPSYEDEPPSRPSRYQQLLDEAARAEAAQAKLQRQARPGGATGAVDLNYVEDVPSADDETIEESGLVGRQAIERILNGRLIEERSLDQ